MKSRIVKCASSLLCVVLVALSGVQVADAQDSLSQQDIIRQYLLEYQQLMDEMQDDQISRSQSERDIDNRQDELRRRIVSQLNNEGLEAYDVNQSSFNEAESRLNTDLEEIGLKPSYSYIVVISGSPSSRAGRAAGGTFTYKGLRMRTLTVTASDDPAMVKSDSVELLKKGTYTKQFIQNLLNTAISAYVSAISKTLGSIMSLMGFDVAKLGNNQTGGSLEYNASANWTREFTQVYGPYDYWSNGSCVEYVNLLSWFDGSYYDKTTNKMENYPSKRKTDTYRSSRYSDQNWRKEQAYQNYINKTVWDTVGDVRLYHKGLLIIALKENF